MTSVYTMRIKQIFCIIIAQWLIAFSGKQRFSRQKILIIGHLNCRYRNKWHLDQNIRFLLSRQYFRTLDFVESRFYSAMRTGNQRLINYPESPSDPESSVEKAIEINDRWILENFDFIIHNEVETFLEIYYSTLFNSSAVFWPLNEIESKNFKRVKIQTAGSEDSCSKNTESPASPLRLDKNK